MENTSGQQESKLIKYRKSILYCTVSQKGLIISPVNYLKGLSSETKVGKK
jgi:hypothetical protein